GVERGERLPRARGPGDLQRPVHAREAHPLLGRPALVVRAHPAHQLAVAGLLAPLVAEAARHDLVERALAGGDVPVHDQAHEAVALVRDPAVALLLYQLAEERVPGVEEVVLLVSGLAEGEDPRPRPEQPHQGAGRQGKGFDGGLHAFDRIVGRTIETFPNSTSYSAVKPSKSR